MTNIICFKMVKTCSNPTSIKCSQRIATTSHASQVLVSWPRTRGSSVEATGKLTGSQFSWVCAPSTHRDVPMKPIEKC